MCVSSNHPRTSLSSKFLQASQSVLPTTTRRTPWGGHAWDMFARTNRYWKRKMRSMRAGTAEIISRTGAIREENPLTAFSSAKRTNDTAAAAKIDAQDVVNRIVRQESLCLRRIPPQPRCLPAPGPNVAGARVQRPHQRPQAKPPSCRPSVQYDVNTCTPGPHPHITQCLAEV
jgi:hypothetical protein